MDLFSFTCFHLRSADRSRDVLFLNLLSILPQEFESLDVVRSLQAELQDQFVSLLPEVLGLVDAVSVSVGVGVGVHSSVSRSLHGAALHMLHQWSRFGLTLEVLFHAHVPTVQLLIGSLQCGEGDEEVVMHSCPPETRLFKLLPTVSLLILTRFVRCFRPGPRPRRVRTQSSPCAPASPT